MAKSSALDQIEAERQVPLQREEPYVLPVGGRPIRILQPLPLATRDWTEFAVVMGHQSGIPFSSGLARNLGLYCLSPGGVDFEPAADRGLAQLIVPQAEPVYDRVRSHSLRLPRNADELVRFRAAIGLSDLPVRVGPCWTGGGSIHESPWVYPPPHLVPALLDDWFAFMWSSRYPWSFRFAIGIPQFLRIHPFAAANGKTVRAFLIKHGQATGEIDPVALALALMLQGRRRDLHAMFDKLYLGRVHEYIEQASNLANWISAAYRAGKDDRRSCQISPGSDVPLVDGFLGRFFILSDETFFRSSRQCSR